MSKMQRILILLIIAIIFIAGAYAASVWMRQEEYVHFPAHDYSFTVEVADTAETRVQGLSGRESLPRNHGMWFVFTDENTRTFWMKGMHFPIDIVWLDRNMRIVGIEQELAPPEPGVSSEALLRYESPPNTQYVLELNAGVVAEAGLEPGDMAVREQ